MKTKYYVIVDGDVSCIGEFEYRDLAIYYCEEEFDNFELYKEQEFIKFVQNCNRLLGNSDLWIIEDNIFKTTSYLGEFGWVDNKNNAKIFSSEQKEEYLKTHPLAYFVKYCPN